MALLFVSYKTFLLIKVSSVQSHLTLWPHELQHDWLHCTSPTPGAYSNSCPWSWWCHPTILSSVIAFSSCFNISQHPSLFQWVSSSHQVAKVLEFQLQHKSFQWRLTGWISLRSKGLSRVFSNTIVQKNQFFGAQLSLQSTFTSIHDYWIN